MPLSWALAKEAYCGWTNTAGRSAAAAKVGVSRREKREEALQQCGGGDVRPRWLSSSEDFIPRQMKWMLAGHPIVWDATVVVGVLGAQRTPMGVFPAGRCW